MQLMEYLLFFNTIYQGISNDNADSLFPLRWFIRKPNTMETIIGSLFLFIKNQREDHLELIAIDRYFLLLSLFILVYQVYMDLN